MGKLAWLVVLWFVGASTIVVAQDVTMSGALPYGAVFVPGVNTPIRVDIRNGTPRAIKGVVRLQSLVASMPEYETPVNVAPYSRLSTTLWVTLAAAPKGSTGRLSLHDESGAQVARTDMAGAPISESVTFMPNGMADCGYMLALTGPDYTRDDEGLEELKAAFAETLDLKVALSELDAGEAPRAVAGYRGATAVQIRNADPTGFDAAQRSSILDYLASGGTLLISAPDPNRINGTWLEDLLPVRLVGARELKQINVTGRGEIPLVGWLPCSEAIAGQGVIVAGDEQYVHVAYRPFGLGRVVFTSFPASGMTAKTSGDLWKQAMGLQRAPAGVAGSGISRQFGQLTEPMLGRPAAPWSVAAIASIGIAGLAFASHVIWRRAARPQAFAVTLGAGIVVAAAFGAMAMFRQTTDPLQEARLTVVDATTAGSLVSEYTAIAGPPQTLSLTASDDRASVAQALNEQDRVLISYWPGHVHRIDVRPQEVQFVTLTSNFDREGRATAVGQFTSDGLSIAVQSELPSPVRLVQLGWGRHRMGVGDIPQGSSTVVAGRATLRPDDEFTSRSGVPSQDESHKARILRALLRSSDAEARARGTWPTLYGWADSYPTLTSTVGNTPDRSAAQTLVRIPLALKPSEPGQTVRVDGMFANYFIGQARGLPFDPQLGIFLDSSLTGRWLFGIRAPSEAGRIIPSKARVQVDLATPQHQVTFRAGQVTGGKEPAKGPTAGRQLQSWTREVGSRTFEFDCSSDDVDEQGTLWLVIEVQQAGETGSMGVPPQWRFGRLVVDLEGKVQ